MSQDNVIRLVASKEKVVRACSTCKHKYQNYSMAQCGAVEMSCTVARITECSEGGLWEPKASAAPMRERILTWWRGPLHRA
jgi:hypothetical protein